MRSGMLRLGGCSEVAAQIQLSKPKARKAARELQVAFVRLPACLPQEEAAAKGEAGRQQKREEMGYQAGGGWGMAGNWAGGCGLDRVQSSRAEHWLP